MTSPVLALALASLGMALAGPPGPLAAAVSAPADVDELLRRADAAFNEGRLLDAWDAIEEAEAIEPEPFYEYMRGLIRQAQGRCDLAVQHWARYLESEPAESDAADVRVLIEECGGLPEPAPEPSIDPTEPNETTEATGPTAPTEPADTAAGPTTSPATDLRPWHRDPLGGALLGTGVASLAAAGGTALGSSLLFSRAPDGDTLMDHDQQLRRSRALGIMAVVSGGVGVALLVGATLRYVQVSRRARGLARRIGPGPTLRF